MTIPETIPIGMQVVCRSCGEEIVWQGRYWDRMGEIKPRHPAIPASVPTSLGLGERSSDEPLRLIFTPEQWDCIKVWIDKVLADRIVPASPQALAQINSTEWPTVYENQLVTIGWFADYQAAIGDRAAIKERADALEQRIHQLEQPWWRRWFH